MSPEPQGVPIRWSNLGSPEFPGEYRYRGFTIKVRSRDIEQVDGDGDAVVVVKAQVQFNGDTVFVISAVHHPA